MKIALSIPDQLISFRFYKNIVIVLLLIYCILSMFLFYANNSTIEKLENNITTIKSLQNETHIDNVGLSENEAYKEMYENLKYSNDKILDTIYWALGGLAAVILALFGANFFFNFRINKGEINNIYSTLNSKVEEIKSKTYQDVQENLNHFIESSRNENKDNFNTFQLKQEKQFNEYSKSIEEKIEKLTKNISELTNSLDTKIKSAREQSVNSTNNINTIMEREINKLNIEINDLSSRVWLLNGVENNAIRCLIHKAQYQLKVNFNIEDSMKKIIELLKKVGHIHFTISSSLQELLDSIPDNYSIHRDKLSEVVKSLSIK